MRITDCVVLLLYTLCAKLSHDMVNKALTIRHLYGTGFLI